ncbi:hypothetical protein HYH03_008214 [Edaphochlamys debaryana]|uniref:DNA polymerase alpha subunit B n=1 Tax=Edaphochlamys debaryana TaxID=47281 RepID=A0A835Y776_9CHLO|nr:hypothetical protein HYH03_008214 [Edaphochlamys debaryana]|eukprot:KAG2493700.1 hypothetical protein HYH03_008214 [Edaphochlamys debaryana]
MAATGNVQAFEHAFTSKKFRLNDASLPARAQQLAQKLHITPDTLVSQYDSYAIVNDWDDMLVTANRLRQVAEYLEAEQRKENARPRAAGAGAGAPGGGFRGLPQASRPTWEDLPDKLDYTTPAAKRQALDPAALNPGSAPGAGGGARTASAAKGGPGQGPGGPQAGRAPAGTPQPPAAPSTQRPGVWATPTQGPAATPSAPATAFAQRTNKGQVVASLNEHLPLRPAPVAAAGPVAVRPLGQPPLVAGEGGEGLFMMELLENKVHALDERILDFADALTAATAVTCAAASAAPAAADTAPPAGSGTPAPSSTPVPPPTCTPPPVATPPPGGAHTPGGVPPAAVTPGPAFSAAVGPAQPLQQSVADVSHEPVWVAGRVLAEAEGAPLNPESLLLEGCREASGGARVRLNVSGLPAFRVFPGQSVCAYGLNPTGHAFIAQRLVTHVPPPPPAAADVAPAARSGGLSMVVAAGPYALSEDLSYSPLDELLAHCTAHPPDVLLLLGPFVDAEAPGLARGAGGRTAEALLRDEVLPRLAAWRGRHPAAALALMPAVRDATAPPVLPQPPMAAAAAALGPADKVFALQNPATAQVGPLVLAAGSSDLLKALSAAELARAPAGAAPAPGERLPALASHVVGQRSLYPLYPAPPGACLDTTHYSQLALPAAPDLLLLPSDLAPFAKLLQPATWAPGAPPGLLPGANGAGAAGTGVGAVGVVGQGQGAVPSTAPVVVLNPGRLSRGGAGGTFAVVAVAPGEGPLGERVRVEVRRV